MSETVTLRAIGQGALIIKSFRDSRKQPYYLSETDKMSEAERKRVLRWSNGLPVGEINLTTPMVVPRTESEFIQKIKEHPLCKNNPLGRGKPMFMVVDHLEEAEAAEAFADKMVTLQEIIMRAEPVELSELCVLKGIPHDPSKTSTMRLAVQKAFNASSAKVDEFVSYFDIKKNKTSGEITSASLKENYKVEVLLRRAAAKKVVQVDKGGNVKYKDEVIGITYADAATNLLNTSQSGKSELLPMIKADVTSR